LGAAGADGLAGAGAGAGGFTIIDLNFVDQPQLDEKEVMLIS
jgi:hypothetical protein